MRSFTYLKCMRCQNEFAGEGVKRKRCAGCHSVFYDSVECQKADWATHKKECVIQQNLLIKAAQHEHPEIKSMTQLLKKPLAMKSIAAGFRDGRPGMNNEGLYFFWLQKWARSGDVAAISILGGMYMFGDGVEQNEEEGVRWFRRGADKGDPEAVCHIGYCYDHGKGVPQSDEMAAKWYKRAVEMEFVPAFDNYGLCLRHGRAVEKNETKAMELFHLAAKCGHDDAMYNYALGLLDADRKANSKEAVEWIVKAAERGHDHAQHYMATASPEGFAQHAHHFPTPGDKTTHAGNALNMPEYAEQLERENAERERARGGKT